MLCPRTSGKFALGQRMSDQAAEPLRIEGQQLTPNWFVKRARQRPVVEYPNSDMLAFHSVRFGYNLDLAYEWGNGLDGIGHDEESG